jgi:hypothetical protein
MRISLSPAAMKCYLLGCYVMTFTLSTENAWNLALKVKTLRSFSLCRGVGKIAQKANGQRRV